PTAQEAAAFRPTAMNREIPLPPVQNPQGGARSRGVALPLLFQAAALTDSVRGVTHGRLVFQPRSERTTGRGHGRGPANSRQGWFARIIPASSRNRPSNPGVTNRCSACRAGSARRTVYSCANLGGVPSQTSVTRSTTPRRARLSRWKPAECRKRQQGEPFGSVHFRQNRLSFPTARKIGHEHGDVVPSIGELTGQDVHQALCFHLLVGRQGSRPGVDLPEI